ncbi:MAG TPA: hypothetical protein VE288_08670 [Rubrobacteraceae bacterium]|nr:hypothetical protein [Rubrobacteraceae bacterium]
MKLIQRPRCSPFEGTLGRWRLLSGDVYAVGILYVLSESSIERLLGLDHAL